MNKKAGFTTGSINHLGIGNKTGLFHRFLFINRLGGPLQFAFLKQKCLTIYAALSYCMF